MTQRERDELKSNAVNIVINSGMIGVGVGIEIEPFRRLVIGRPEVSKVIPANPYLFAFNSAVIETLFVADIFVGEPKEPITFIFENHPQWSSFANQMFTDLKSDSEWPKEKRDRLGAAAFEDKKRHKPLQAADHIAYETWRYMQNRHLRRPLRPAMRRFLSWNQNHGRYFDENGLIRFIQILKEDGKL